MVADEETRVVNNIFVSGSKTLNKHDIIVGNKFLDRYLLDGQRYVRAMYGNTFSDSKTLQGKCMLTSGNLRVDTFSRINGSDRFQCDTSTRYNFVL